jgi:hypothetical protein
MTAGDAAAGVAQQARLFAFATDKSLICRTVPLGWQAMGTLSAVRKLWIVAAILALFSPARAEPPSSLYVVKSDHWSEADEQGYRDFIRAVGEADCGTLDACLHGPANPFRNSDPPQAHFAADCSDLPYVLRFYYAWKKGLPYSYASEVESRNGEGDSRFSRQGNSVAARTDVPGGVKTGTRIIAEIREAVSSANYRLHPESDGPLAPDFYSPAIAPASIRPGSMVYDPAGHVAVVFRVDPDGRVHVFDAHTDYSLTELVFDVRFARMRPALGAGFKNWRPQRLLSARVMADGTLRGGHVEVAKNAQIADFSAEQYYGTDPAADWARGSFTVKGEKLDFYDFVRARLAGKLVFEPLKEVRETAWSLCSDLHYRAQAVELAAGLAREPHPRRLPRNIYGSEGDWETLSTPSRDARLKTVFKALRDMVQRFAEMRRRGDPHLEYAGRDLGGDMLNTYVRVAAACRIAYRKSDGSFATLNLEEARQRLFAFSFDPYHCPERRWGAAGTELASCPEDADKEAWYGAEQGLRNRIERNYDARMDFTREELLAQAAVKPPETDVIGYLKTVANSE